MALIAELEDCFEIALEMDDIIDFSSYEKGIELLKKYDVEVWLFILKISQMIKNFRYD